MTQIITAVLSFYIVKKIVECLRCGERPIEAKKPFRFHRAERFLIEKWVIRIQAVSLIFILAWVLSTYLPEIPGPAPWILLGTAAVSFPIVLITAVLRTIFRIVHLLRGEFPLTNGKRDKGETQTAPDGLPYIEGKWRNVKTERTI